MMTLDMIMSTDLTSTHAQTVLFVTSLLRAR